MPNWKSLLKIPADFRYWLLLVLPLTAMYFIDPVSTRPLAFSILAVFATMGVMLVVRKIMLNYYDTREFLDLVRQVNIAASIVVFGVLMFMSVILVGVVWWVRG